MHTLTSILDEFFEMTANDSHVYNVLFFTKFELPQISHMKCYHLYSKLSLHTIGTFCGSFLTLFIGLEYNMAASAVEHH